MTLKFKIEQVAIYPADPVAAKKLLSEMGCGDWSDDIVVADGSVFGQEGRNYANLSFEYSLLQPANEFEILEYVSGANWMDCRSNSDPNRVSHFGMHCTEQELVYWREFFERREIKVAQEVKTLSHNNPAIKGKRWYQYVIFDTFPILGVDLKFIVRKDHAPDI